MAVQSPDEFANTLLIAAFGATVGAVGVVKKGAQNIKTESQDNVRQSAPTHNAGAAGAITYDEPTITGARVEAEVGYDKDLPGGDLGNLLEFGGGGDRSPAHRDIGRAADNEEPRFEAALQAMATRLL